MTILGSVGGAGALTVTGGSGNTGVGGAGIFAIGGPVAANLLALPGGTIQLLNSATGSAAITVNGGLLTGQHANTFAGTITLQSGQIDLAASQSLGTANLLLLGGTVDNVTGGTVSLATPLSFNGDTSFNSTTGTIVFAANVTITINVTATLDATSAVQFLGSFTGPGILTFTGKGTLKLLKPSSLVTTTSGVRLVVG